MPKMIEVNLPVIVLKEGKTFVAYSPVLDLSTCGATEEEAKEMFGDALDAFLEELVEAGTLEEVLLNLGWQKKPKKKWLPPTIIQCESKKLAIPV